MEESKYSKVAREAKIRGYYYDDAGQIFTRNGRLLKLSMLGPYLRFRMRADKLFGSRTSASVKVHRFIAYCKYGESALRPGVHVRHLNGNYLDNRPDNLAIGTPSENMMDKPEDLRRQMALRAASFVRKFTDE